MKIHLISYNEESILNNGFVRFVNAFILCSTFALQIINERREEDVFKLSIAAYIAVLVGTVIVTAICRDIIIKHTTFYEWDYTERKKKTRFLSNYNAICIFLSGALCLSIGVAIKWLTCEEFQNIPFLKYGSLFPPLLFIFNLLNIPSLYNLSNDLRIEYKIQNKPDNWQEEGEETSDKDMIREIYKQDFGIDQWYYFKLSKIHTTWQKSHISHLQIPSICVQKQQVKWKTTENHQLTM